MIQTCKDCTERAFGCHSKCERYLKAKARQQLANALKQKRDEKYPRHATFTKAVYNGKIEKRPIKH